MAKGTTTTTTLAKLNLNLCLSMLMKQPHHHPQLPSTTSPPPPTTAAATLFKTYNSLYEDTDMTSDDTDMVEDDEVEDPTTPDLTAAYASRRFFISSPGRSNSIVDSLSLSALGEDEEEEEVEVVEGGVAVHRYSPDPYTDFRRSMEEMVAAREVARVEDAWEYLQELLLTYLALNPESMHKYIVGAFADLVFCLLSNNNKIININNNNNNNNNNINISNNNCNNNVSCSSSSSCGGGDLSMSE